MNILNRILNVLNWVLVAYTLFSFLSPYVDPKHTIFFGIFGLIFPYLVFFNLLFIFYWLAQRSKRAWLSTAVLILAIPFITNIVGLNIIDGNKSSTGLTVATYNMQFAKPTLFKDPTTAKRAGNRFESFLKTINDIDILCVQEFNAKTKSHLDKATDFKYNHILEDITVAIFSKYPILKTGALDFGSKVNICLWADIQVKDKTVRVYTAHLQSNQNSAEPPILVDMKGQEQISTKGLLGLLRYYQKYTSMRVQQSKQIRNHQKKSKHPSIICGDFNDPPQSYTYRMISEGLNDSFCEKGIGLGASYGGKIPALRIDYILADPKIDILSHDIVDHKFSDHFIIKSRIDI